MHELSLMAGVFEVIESTLSNYRVKKVTHVKLKIGKLTNADPEALNLAFEAYAKGTLCEDAKLIVETIPVRGLCKSCGQEFSVDEFQFFCYKCQSTRIEVIQGEELLLESLEVEE